MNLITIELPTAPLKDPVSHRVILDCGPYEVALRSQDIEAWLELARAIGAELQDWPIEDGLNVVSLAREAAGLFEALADDWGRALRNLG